MKKTPEIPLTNLSEEERSAVERFDATTDELYTLRNQFALFYKQYRKYLPPSTRIRDLFRMRQEGKTVSELINLNKWQHSDDPVEKYTQRAYIEAAFDHALDTYALIHERHGDWGAHPHSFSQEELDIRDYYRERYTTKAQTVREREGFLEKLVIAEEALDRMRSVSSGVPDIVHQDAIRRVYEDKKQIVRDLEALLLKSPDTYITLKELDLREAKRVFDDNGTIVETPYVQRKIARVREILSSNRPVFIHGELGTGKTELAKHIARTYLSRAHLARWETAHPRPEKTKDRSTHAQKEWKAALEIWEQERRAQAEPFLIAGRKDIDVESITAGRGIRRKETVPPAEQARIIHEESSVLFQSIDPHAAFDSETRERIMRMHEQAWLESFKSPVETVALLGPLLQAMKEGRPLIIDEMNAIPHHVLIIMNDVLTRKVGDIIPALFPGLEPFRIQEGFCVIATGNYKPEDGKMYVGRQQIDAAFLSRFGIISYDYLPMEREAEAEELSVEEQRAYREKNELYHMLVTRLLGSDLTARLPQGSLEKIEKLARVARMIQDVFSGKETSEFQIDGAKVKPSTVLSENVLSVRHLIPIIDAWRSEGFVRELDEYIFREYISRSLGSRPKEAVFLYSILNIQGDFFQHNEHEPNTWPKLSEPENILAFPIEEKFHAMVSGKRVATLPEPSALKKYSSKDIITALYGPPPIRTHISQKIVERFGARSAHAPEDPVEKLAREQEAQRISDTLSTLARDGFPVVPKN